jgi:ADP-ribosylglycohydrolase
VEFQSAEAIDKHFPDGVRDLVDGGVWNTLAGQPTDDSELALALARTLAAHGQYSADAAAAAYASWLRSRPFDIGNTTRQAFSAAAGAQEAPADAARAAASQTSQANGALMRCSPLAVWGHALPRRVLAGIAREDARMSHPHPTCQDANAAFVAAAAAAVGEGLGPEATWAIASEQARRDGATAILDRLRAAREKPPDETDGAKQGWVLVAFHNAFHQLLFAPSIEEGLARTLALGGDTDTNAAIAGALLGAVHGAQALPSAWVDRILACRPLSGHPGVHRPRPKAFWPVDALLLSERLVRLGQDARRAGQG